MSVNRDTRAEEANKYLTQSDDKRRQEQAEREKAASLSRIERHEQQKASTSNLRSCDEALKSLPPNAFVNILTSLTSRIFFPT